MDLWIRSQNKGALIKVEILGYADGTINAYLGNNEIVLGEYSSDERALEVLDEIQRKITPVTIIKQTKPIKYIDYNRTISDATLYVEDVSEVKEVGMIIYEMPKE